MAVFARLARGVCGKSDAVFGDLGVDSQIGQPQPAHSQPCQQPLEFQQLVAIARGQYDFQDVLRHNRAGLRYPAFFAAHSYIWGTFVLIVDFGVRA